MFDIYFTSPVLSGLQTYSMELTPPAKRVVLVVVDGLPAYKAFGSKEEILPSLRKRISSGSASWGVSHTRVPTESRVGHVSLIGGFYEDVGAISKGWQDNPVDYDHVFNQSRHTWAFGAHDIIKYFNKGEASLKMSVQSFPSEMIDFAEQDPSVVDNWVFDHVNQFLEDANQNQTLSSELKKDKSVFFVHLIATDTIGHNKKPDSQEYDRLVRNVDRGIETMANKMESFFGDSSTAFIVTSDHGMTLWGTHGAGHTHETETPIIAWGAGVKKSQVKRNINMNREWGLGDVERKDIEQADVAVLMSALIGSSIPANSVGNLPLSYLDASEHYKAEALLLNARQIYEQYLGHERSVDATSLRFQPFYEFTITPASHHLDQIKLYIQSFQYEESIKLCKQFIDITLRGIRYYYKYNRFSLSFAVNMGFISWIVLLILRLLKRHTLHANMSQAERRHLSISWLYSRMFRCVAVAVTVFTIVLKFYKSSVLMHVIYTVFPLITFWLILMDHMTICKLLIGSRMDTQILKYAAWLLVLLVGVILIVIAFFHRESLSIIAVGIALMPWARLPRTKTNATVYFVFTLLTLSSILLAIFPLMPVIGKSSNYGLVFFAGFLSSTAGLTYSMISKDRHLTILTIAHVCCLFVKVHTEISILRGDGLPYLNQVISWSSVVVVPALALFTPPTSVSRLPALCLGLSSLYLQTSVSYESLFLITLCASLASWIWYEKLTADQKKFTLCQDNVISDDTSENISLEDFRVAFVFLYYIFISFFGTGNIASVNSFDPASTNCFQTVLNQFVMGTVLLMKVTVPFLIVIMFFSALQTMINKKGRGLFLIVLLMTDLMAVIFFFLVRDEGSWLDIGQSLSHFVITLSFVIFLIPAVELGHFLTGRIQWKQEKSHFS